MADTNYDRACRHLATEAGAGMMLWLLGLGPEQLRFDAIADSVQVLPGKERRCDVIARLADLTRGGVPCAAIVEFQITPDPEMFGRMLIAGGMTWLKLKAAEHPGDRYDLIAVVVNLTGKGNCARGAVVGTAEWRLTPRELNLETFAAAKVLDEVESGAAPKEVLAWIPLMQGGGEDAIIERWLEIARREPDLKKRGEYALAKVFAQAVGQKDLWVRRLEGLTMIDTPLVAEWKAEAAAKTLVAVLEGRFSPLPEEVAARIRASKDADQVERWAVKAGTAQTLDQFRHDTGL